MSRLVIIKTELYRNQTLTVPVYRVITLTCNTRYFKNMYIFLKLYTVLKSTTYLSFYDVHPHTLFLIFHLQVLFVFSKNYFIKLI